MALLLLLFAGIWAQRMTTMSTPITEILETSSTGSTIRDPKEFVSSSAPTPDPPSSAPLGTSELSPSGTSADTTSLEPDPATSQEVSIKTSNASSVSAVPLEHSTETDKTTSSSATSAPSVTMATGSSDTSGPSVTTATSSSDTSGPFVAPAVNSNETSGPPVTQTTGSVEPSSETPGLPATIATSSTETASVGSDAMMSTLEPSTNTQRSNGMLLVPVLVALLVVTVLVALLLLWRRRQKRRTGVLTLSRVGKRNGVVDAWAGPAQVPDEEAPTAAGLGGDKGSGVPETEGSRGRPTLTTFFSRRKSRQGSLVLEELKSGSGSGQMGEEEPLVGSDSEAAGTPPDDGPKAGDGAAPQCL